MHKTSILSPKHSPCVINVFLDKICLCPGYIKLEFCKKLRNSFNETVCSCLSKFCCLSSQRSSLLHMPTPVDMKELHGDFIKKRSRTGEKNGRIKRWCLQGTRIVCQYWISASWTLNPESSCLWAQLASYLWIRLFLSILQFWKTFLVSTVGWLVPPKMSYPCSRTYECDLIWKKSLLDITMDLKMTLRACLFSIVYSCLLC